MTTTYGYDSVGNLSEITSPLGFVTTMGYDSSGRLISRRDPRGNVPDPPAGYLTEWTYEDGDEVETLTDAGGNVTSFAYHENGLLASVTREEEDTTERTTSFAYDNANRLWQTTDPRSGVEERLYWADGQLASVETPEGRLTSYDYDDAGQLVEVVEPNGNAGTASDYTWTYGYDDAGNRTSEAHPDGGTVETAYDALDRPTSWEDALDHVTSVDYDANGNVTKRTNDLGDFRTYTYDNLDRLETETDERQGNPWTYTYYPTGEPESVESPLGNLTTYELDDDGRTVEMVEPRGNDGVNDPADYTWTYGYDEAGNRTSVLDPLGNELAYAYNAVGNVVEASDQRGNDTAFAYDTMNRLDEVTPPAAGATGTLQTSYGYDAAGNLALRTDPNGHETSWDYDLDGLMIERTTEVGTWNYSYDDNGNLETLETPAGSSTGTVGDGTITYSYDRMSRLTEVDYSDSTPDVSRAYDLAGRLEEMSDGAGTVTYAYDDADRLEQISRTGGGSGLNGTLAYAYDEAGNITQRTNPDTTVATSSFDDDGRLATITSAGVTTSFGYDEAGNITTVTLPTGNGHVASRGYDEAGRLTSVTNSDGTTLSAFTWTLDETGNPTKVQTTRGTTDSYDAYEYDTRNRLTASCYGISPMASDCTGASNEISYAYDKVSNRTQEARSGSVGNTGTIDYDYNAADQLTETDDGTSTTSYSYDDNGNQTAAGSRSFTYDLADRLISTTESSVTTTYAYDGDNRRVSSTVAGGADINLTWDPLAESGIPELALEREDNGDLIRRYLNGPLGAISMENPTETFYYHTDPLGTITDLTDEDGDPHWRYTYEAYGAPLTTTNVSGTAPENRLRHTGQYLDPETNHYHLRAREYDPSLGVFGALDPIEAPLTAGFDASYVYVSGRPTSLVDLLGLSGTDRGYTYAYVQDVIWASSDYSKVYPSAWRHDNVAHEAWEERWGHTPSFCYTNPSADPYACRSKKPVISFTDMRPMLVRGLEGLNAMTLPLDFTVVGGLKHFALAGASRLAGRWCLRSTEDVGEYLSKQAATAAKGAEDLPAGVGRGPHAGESIPARGPGRDFTAAEREAIDDIGARTGCHTCGNTTPGTRTGHFIPDHQPPSSLLGDEAQRLFPHCLTCSRDQGLAIARMRRQQRGGP